jgi:hypothetical protein
LATHPRQSLHWPKRLALFLILGLSLAAPLNASAASVKNGGFENLLSDWLPQNLGPGQWYAYSGTSSPFGVPIAAPPEGSFAAVSDESNPSTPILYQDVALEPTATHTLSLFVYYRSAAPIAVPSPDSLLYSPISTPNQQYRIDVMKASAPLTSVNPADILLNVFRTKVGDPTVLLPTFKTVDLTPFAGQTVRLRFAVVANVAPFNASTDAVTITSKCVVPNLRRKTLKAAKKSLLGAACHTGTVKRRGHKPRRVKRQFPVAGTVLPGGSEVNLTVKG